jgi:hypothetical protein
VVEEAVTEVEWQSTTDVLAMLRCLAEQHGAKRRKAGRRKLRLFGCGCCRQLFGWMADHRSREAVEVAERLADGRASESEVQEATARAREAAWEALRAAPAPITVQAPRPAGDESRGCDWPPACEEWAAQAAFVVLNPRIGNAAYAAMAASPLPGNRLYPGYQRMHRWQADVLRCLFGNPFRAASAAPGWLTPTVRALASGIYDERAFDQLPILADALQDAGCDNPDVLDHCRGAVPHVRGCWVVDLLLGGG